MEKTIGKYQLQAIKLALSPLALIADRWESNDLDDDARRFWGREDEIQNTRRPEEILLFSGRGGSELLFLSDALLAREVLREIEELEEIVFDDPTSAVADSIEKLLKRVKSSPRQ